MKRNQTFATTISQSKKLTKIGIDPSTSDFHYDDYKRHPELIWYPRPGNSTSKSDLPAWSIDALTKLLHPKWYMCGFNYRPAVVFEKNKWVVKYTYTYTSGHRKGLTDEKVIGKATLLVDALVAVIQELYKPYSK